jgi:hypothetical protein
MDWILTSKYICELANCAWQVAQFPELHIYPAVKGDRQWHYDLICTPFPKLSKKDIHISQLQEELIGAIAGLQLAYAKRKKIANREKQLKQYEAAAKGQEVRT